MELDIQYIPKLKYNNTTFTDEAVLSMSAHTYLAQRNRVAPENARMELPQQQWKKPLCSERLLELLPRTLHLQSTVQKLLYATKHNIIQRTKQSFF